MYLYHITCSQGCKVPLMSRLWPAQVIVSTDPGSVLSGGGQFGEEHLACPVVSSLLYNCSHGITPARLMLLGGLGGALTGLTSSGRRFPRPPGGWTEWLDCSSDWSTPAGTHTPSFPQEMTWTRLGQRGLEDNQCKILIERNLCLLNGNNGGQPNFSRQTMFSSDFLLKGWYFPNFSKSIILFCSLYLNVNCWWQL